MDTATENTESIEITEVVKQGLIFGPTMFCVAIKVNDVGEKTDYTFGDVEVGMSIYMDDTSVAGGPEKVKKEIRKCTKMEVEKKMQYSLSKT